MNENQPINIGMIGCGTVGGGVASLLRDQAAMYAHTLGRPISLRRILVRDVPAAIKRGDAPEELFTDNPDDLFNDEQISIVIEVAGGIEPVGGYVRRALAGGRHVVTANKALLAAQGPELFALAREHGVSIAFEASCAGGVPVVSALLSGLSANEFRGLYGILNGTCNFILTEMATQGKTYDQALADAKRLGYAEADESLDVSGADAAQKLAILASLAFGRRIMGDQVRCIGIDSLEQIDIRHGDELGYDVKLLALAERWPGSPWIALSVRPCFIHKHDLLAKVSGPFNAVSLHGHAVGHVMLYGRGAGRMPTASAVVSDLLSVAGGVYPAQFRQLRMMPDLQEPAQLVEWQDVESRFYLRLNALDVPGTMAKVMRILGDRGISISAVLQHEANSGEMVPVVVVTHVAVQGDLDQAAMEIEKLDAISGKPMIMRIVDLQE